MLLRGADMDRHAACNVEADTAITVFVVHSFLLYVRGATGTIRQCGVGVAAKAIDRLVYDGIRGVGIRRGKEDYESQAGVLRALGSKRNSLSAIMGLVWMQGDRGSERRRHKRA